MKKHLWIFSFLFTLSVTAWADEESLNKAFGTSGGYTDKEMYDAKNFKHEGFRERKKNEQCAAQDAKCAPDSYNEGVLIDGELESHMGKAYTMIFGGLSFLGGSGGPSNSRTTDVEVQKADGTGPEMGADNKPKTEAKEEKRTDYCMYAAMGWEMVMMLVQKDLNGNVEQETAHIKDIQMKSLVALQKNHESRQRTATMQAVAYGAVSLCYVYYIATGSYSDPMTLLKGAAAVALTTLYGFKAAKHAKAADAVGRVIANLPKAGDCNPYTDTFCFCTETTSKEMYPPEYENVCVRKRPAASLVDTTMGCGAMDKGKMTYDKQCKCRANKTCFNTQVKAFNPKFNLGNNVLSNANQGFDLLEKGEPDPAKLSKYSTDAKAMALKSFPKNPKLPKVKLNDEQKKIAASMSRFMPSDAAAIAAVAPVGKPPGGLGVGAPAGLDKLSEETKKKVAEAIKANYNQNGGGPEVVTDEEKPGFQMPTFGDQGAEPDNSAEVISFAEKAMNNADVSNSPDTPIFDIISNRYRRSGWNKVESPEMKAQ